MDPSRPELLVGTGRRRLLPSDSPASAAPSDPAWFVAFLKTHRPEQMLNARWQGLRSRAGAPPLRVLMDEASRRASPLAQQAQFDLLRSLIAEERLGFGDHLDFVPVVLTSIGLLGYEVGADSPLMRDMALQLDRQIELTLEALHKAPGDGKFGLAFTAAHGSPPEPDPSSRPLFAMKGDDVARAVNGALSALYDVSTVKNRYVERYVYPFLYLRHEQLRRYGIEAREARRAAGEAALRVPGVAAYYTADGACSRGGEWVERFRGSFHAVRSGDLMLAYQPNLVEEAGAGRGVSYGSLYGYDTRVPLIFYGEPFRAQTLEGAVETVDIAPTLARAMRVAPPSSSVGHVLAQAFAARAASRK
ncbi:MAG: alkaline phosphatase family protein [Candidatus Solibacter usitatus]|nr:alkaline phosphatase family protein [Candidatus Solibacter usitatus]